MKIVAITLAALILSACGTTQTPEPRIIIQPVVIPVPVTCVPKNLGPAPSYPDTDEALLNSTPEGRYQLLIAGRGLRSGRLGEVESAIEGCRL